VARRRLHPLPRETGSGTPGSLHDGIVKSVDNTGIFGDIRQMETEFENRIVVTDPDNKCPICDTPHHPSATECTHCFSDLPGGKARSDLASGAAPATPIGVHDDGELLLDALDGGVLKVKNGDIVGRTAVGKELLAAREAISREHACFVQEGNLWYVIDLDSRNGTFLDGEKLPPRRKILLGTGQQLQLSPAFTVRVRVPVPEQARTAKFTAISGETVPDPARQRLIILFADIKGSVDYFQEMGTIVAHNWILTLFKMLTAIIVDHRGKHLKNIGDAILAVFPEPREAAMAAREMQNMIREHNSQVEEHEQYFIRIGMNMGQVLYENNDVFGNAVNIASRVQARTPPGRIFVTEQLYQAIAAEQGLQLRFVGNEQLKGVKELTGIYEILSSAEQTEGDTKLS
jgi:class 3 adenylate cyclase